MYLMTLIINRSRLQQYFMNQESCKQFLTKNIHPANNKRGENQLQEFAGSREDGKYV